MTGAMFPPEIVARKAKCFSSSWWAVVREPDILNDRGELVEAGRAKTFVLLSKGEMNTLAYTGKVTVVGYGEAKV